MATTALTQRAGLETDDIQGLVLQGYGKLRAAAFIVLEVAHPEGARRWLRDCIPDITLGGARPTEHALNVAFTAEGLQRLGLPHEVVAGFALEFVEGMTSPHRSRLLVDEADAAPTRWAWGGPAGAPVHALLMVYATDADELARYLKSLRSGLGNGGLTEVAVLPTQDIGFGEHFGFRDGLSQPAFAEPGPSTPTMHDLQPGELLLGHLNEHGQYSRSPLVPVDQDPDDLLVRRQSGEPGTTAPVDTAMSDAHDFGRNGSYVVVRTLQQDVGAFWRFVDQASRRADGSADRTAGIRLAARMVGRWPSGAPLAESPDLDRPDLAEDNDFGYAQDDADGYRCPLGAHVRRANPRDSRPPSPGTQKSIDVGKRHRLLRRGRSFGPPIDIDQALAEEPSRAGQRGLHFVALCADIARQFEFVSHSWVNNPNFAGLLDDADPLLSGHGEGGDSFTVQAEPLRRRLTGLPAFVTVRGGAYFFLPSARALRYLTRP